MLEIYIHRHALEHGLSKSDICDAWGNFAKRQPRGIDFEVRIGFDKSGKEIGMVGALLQNGDVLIIHAKSPAIASIRKRVGGIIMEYVLKSGKKLTEKDIACLGEAIENGDLSVLGTQGKISVGRPKLSNEPLVTMTFKIPKSDAQRIQSAYESEGVSKSDFLRRASISMANKVLA